ncbi:metal-dependent hydrolase [Actinocrinis puniceicyclus]|uniref:Metal-dependent hydrolase n=1 Tax=Actinocrinis puniceicyclus TaxID=977794 RepID=A0A8J8BBJ7_9ACTN|nr:metal-dependent hydrolase [Actinocrinis puniceicyclus]MBS2963203.1 metal-dependent hydrolase [Actinocrinis puniceicyclus]
MALANTTTLVTFPSGTTEGSSTIVAAVPLPGGVIGVVTDTTPFHPLDHTWPDQPGDSGIIEFDTVEFGGARCPVVDCATGAIGPEGEFALGDQIPVRRADPQWTWLAVHLVDVAGTRVEPKSLLGRAVVLRVDAPRRAALSAVHTGCHLLAFALNETLAERWHKPVRLDALGSPDFDALAMDRSRMDPHASTDRYRIGKSLRKKGFDPDGLAESLDAITARVNARLADWIATDAPVRVETPGPELTARRRWVCALPQGAASVDCGGTHVSRLGELGSLTTSVSLSEDGTELVAVTVPKRG